MRWILGCIFTVSFQFIFQTELVYAEEYVTVFDNNGGLPVTRLDLLPELTPEIRAILALYALENGAGCEGKVKDDLIRCDMTEKLGLGLNCSAEHIQLVRSWFDVTPNLSSRWNERWNAKAKSPGTLEELCYNEPDSGVWRNIWESISIKVAGKRVKVEAILVWGSRYGHGKDRYINSYEINSHTIIETSSERQVLSDSQESMFGPDAD